MARYYRVTAHTRTEKVFDRVMRANTRASAATWAWIAYRMKGGPVSRAQAETTVTKASAVEVEALDGR